MEFNNLTQKDLDNLAHRDDELFIDLSEDKPDTEGYGEVKSEVAKPLIAMTLEEIKNALWWARFYGHTSIKLNSSREVLQAELNRLNEQGIL